MNPFSAHSRVTNLQSCEKESLDLIVVGGGCVGAGIFVDAANRGLKTALFEQNDFASATSSSSSKLIHGGLRYLELMDFGLIFESCRERKKLLEISKDLVHPLEFIFPVYKGQRRGLLTIYAGTLLYSFLALFRNLGMPKKCNPDQTVSLAPLLNRRGLKGSVRYFDAGTIDSRLTLSAIKTGHSLGGLACNHAKVVEYLRENDRVCGVVVEDQITKKKYNVRSRWVVNAIGPWTDPSKMRVTKGVHMVVQGNPFQIQQAIVMLSPVDQRVVFIIPWCHHTLIGTTDTDFHESPDQAHVNRNDIEYLLKTVRYYFPTVQVPAQQVLSTFVGLRCLPHENKANPSDVSREHILFSDTPGLLNVAGGKLTTFLSMGREINDWICKREPHIKQKSKPIQKLADVEPLPEHETITGNMFLKLIREEMAVTVRDLLKYRTLSFYLTPDHGESLIENATHAIKSELQLSDQEMNRQIEEYRKDIENLSIALK